MDYNMMLLTNMYNHCHKSQYPKGLTKLYKTWTPTSNKNFPESKFVVWFGLQGFIKTFLTDYFNEYFFNRPIEEIVKEYKLCIHNTFGENVTTDYIEALHKLGYLPIEIKALPEGTKVPYGVPCCTITNTHPDFVWLVNYFVTLFSCNMWLPTTTATKSFIFRQIIEKYIELTSDNTDWKRIGVKDYSFKDMSSIDATIVSSAAFLTSFSNTSTIPSVRYLREKYNTEDVGNVNASIERSCIVSNFAADGDEEKFFVRAITELYPNESFSYDADTFDYWNFIINILPKYKDLILNHNGKISVRLDDKMIKDAICGKAHMWKTHESKKAFEHYYMNSEMMNICFKDERDEKGNLYPIYIEIDNEKLVATWETVDNTEVFHYRTPTIEERGILDVLWEYFGGTVNSKGYKVLNPHIGLVYGNVMRIQDVEKTCEHMMNLGFAVENVVFEVNSYPFQYNTRDTQGWSFKTTYGEIYGSPILICDSSKSNDDLNMSQRGMVSVYRDTDNTIKFVDGIYPGMITTDDLKMSDVDLMETVFIDGSLIKDISLSEIRLRIHSETGGF